MWRGIGRRMERQPDHGRAQVTLGLLARNQGAGCVWTRSYRPAGMRLVLQTADWIGRGTLEVITCCFG